MKKECGTFIFDDFNRKGISTNIFRTNYNKIILTMCNTD